MLHVSACDFRVCGNHFCHMLQICLKSNDVFSFISYSLTPSPHPPVFFRHFLTKESSLLQLRSEGSIYMLQIKTTRQKCIRNDCYVTSWYQYPKQFIKIWQIVGSETCVMSASKTAPLFFFYSDELFCFSTDLLYIICSPRA